MPPRKKPAAAARAPAAPPPTKRLRAEDFGESDEHIDLAAVVIAITAGFSSNPDRSPTPKGIVGMAKLVLESEEDWPESATESEDGEDVFFDLLCTAVQATCARAPASTGAAALVADAVAMADALWDTLLVGCAELDESGGDDEDGEDDLH